MLAAAIAVKLSSPGPLIFKQERVGLHNRTFKMYKFRSMTVQKASEEVSKWTTKNDVRVTPVGRFIRKTSIDELPQLFNVLKGDMSLIGPRPERPFFVDKFKEEIPRYMIKHQVRPGMNWMGTGNGSSRRIHPFVSALNLIFSTLKTGVSALISGFYS